MHYETFTKKHDIKRKVHRHENWQKTRGVGENKKKPTTSLISSDKKDKKMLNSVQVGFKKHSSLSTSKSDNMRSILKIKKPTSHFEDHFRPQNVPIVSSLVIMSRIHANALNVFPLYILLKLHKFP